MAVTDAAEGGEQGGRLRRALRTLGPGFITGASDDDPSGIGTYSQAGAQLGFGIGWTMLLTFPLMAAIQEISARIGRTTGRGVIGNLCRSAPAPLLYAIVALLFVANVINIGADLSAMADALKTMIGGPAPLYVALFAIVCVAGIVFLNYQTYATVLKWSALSLFAYVAAMLAVDIPWREAIVGLVLPKITWTADYFTTLVAIFGTTISPYLFVWQAAQEVEDLHQTPARRTLIKAPQQAPGAFARIRADTLVGMAFSNLIALAIIFTTAAALHKTGHTDVQSSVQAAQALRPIAGDFAFVIFAIGIIGTGLLAVPVLAGASAYAVGDACKWPVGLGRKPGRAIAFYATLAGAMLLGVVLTIMPIDPIKALYWSAVINGVAAAPVMIIMMLMVADRKIMGRFIISGWLRALGWAATLAMAACVIGMAATMTMSK
jgi:Mn2+/Fe2+ NRAMP family transporter